jgi:hypothetical protein
MIENILNKDTFVEYIQQEASIFELASKLCVPLTMLAKFNPELHNKCKARSHIRVPSEDMIFSSEVAFNAKFNEIYSCKIILSPNSVKFVSNQINKEIKFISVSSIIISGHPSLVGDIPEEDLSAPFMSSLLTINYFDNIPSSNNKKIEVTGCRCELESVQKIILKKRKEILNDFPIGKKLPSVLEIVGIKDSILTLFEINILRSSVPLRFQYNSWNLIFTSSLHGTSIKSALQKISSLKTILILIEAEHHEIFGTFLPFCISPSRNYYGSFDVFVFSLNPQMRKYPCTEKNIFIVSSTASEILIGGNNAAIHLKNTLDVGFSSQSNTFDSPQFTKENRFEIIRFEIWNLN